MIFVLHLPGSSIHMLTVTKTMSTPWLSLVSRPEEEEEEKGACFQQIAHALNYLGFNTC